MDLELSQSQYSRRENGFINFSIEEIRILCKILDLDIHKTVIELIDGSNLVQGDDFENLQETKSSQLIDDLGKLLGEAQALVSLLQNKTHH